ncbi:c-type cytochrome [Aliiroseovarius sp. KMU-50]|uniref:C-type cytochrome n=1 Tax=Aliiroseovarius salicola TaxID=3009082 RepID=A0ABT4W5S8_9RHOB|nr:c-type cytochrome [Aliiroseovarius sp. KMU-50]MDA5095876.1 c-type cytochrome [Aliiroseovarius sp. KMU-50]
MSKWGLFIGGALLAGIATSGWQALQPAPQGHSMVSPDTSDIAIGDPIEAVNLPSELSSDAVIGKRMFDAKCAACHGENAAGQNGVAPPLIHKIYEPSHHADEAFQRAVKIGVRAHHWKFGDMPRVEGLTRGDVQYLTQYVRELQRENGIN